MTTFWKKIYKQLGIWFKGLLIWFMVLISCKTFKAIGQLLTD